MEKESEKHGKERRGAPRLSSRNLIHYGIRRADGLWTLSGIGRTEDLAIGGLRLVTSEPLPVAGTIDVALQLGDAVRRGRARVLWVREVARDKSYEAGIALETASLPLFKDLCERTLLESAPRTTFEGDELGELLERITRERQSGLVAVDSDEHGRSFIAFRDGEVIGARGAHGETGMPAVCKTLGERRGIVTFVRHDLAALEGEHKFRLPDSLARLIREARTNEEESSAAA